jgi:hypothetical protein
MVISCFASPTDVVRAAELFGGGFRYVGKIEPTFARQFCFQVERG